MSRLLTVLLATGLAAFAVVIYGIKYDTRALQERVVELEKAIKEERDAIAVLRAEWSHLNRPDRLERLVRKHLGLKPLEASQVVPLEELNVPRGQAGDRISRPGIAPEKGRRNSAAAVR